MPSCVWFDIFLEQCPLQSCLKQSNFSPPRYQNDMVLSSGYGQRQLHQWSRQAVQHQKIKEPTRQSKIDPTNTHIPAYGTAATVNDNPKIPNPSLFAFESKTPENNNKGLPTVGECAAHLELLHSFHRIYVEVSSSIALDAVLGIKVEPRKVYRTKYVGGRYRRKQVREKVALKDDTFKERRKTKWNFYLALAAARFLAWAEAVEKVVDGSMASQATSLHLPPLGRLYHCFI